MTQPLRRVSRSSLLRGTAVIVITGAISLAAACSDEDLVDTIPPPRPQHTMTDGPMAGPPSGTNTPETAATSTPSSTSTSTSTSTAP